MAIDLGQQDGTARHTVGTPLIKSCHTRLVQAMLKSLPPLRAALEKLQDTPETLVREPGAGAFGSGRFCFSQL